MTIAPASPAAFSISTVISRAFGVLGRNFVAFLLLSLLLVGVPTSLASLAQLFLIAPEMAAGAEPDAFSVAAVGLLLLSGLIGAASSAVLQGAIIHGTVSDL